MTNYLNELIANYGRMSLKWLATSGLRVVLIIIGAYVLSRILFRLIHRIEVMAATGDIVVERLWQALSLARAAAPGVHQQRGSVATRPNRIPGSGAVVSGRLCGGRA